MAKTITIPTSFGYPTATFIINHKRYILETGVEITVDDAIAEVVNNAIALQPKENPNAGADVSVDTILKQPYFRGWFTANTILASSYGTPNDFAYSSESGTVWRYQDGTGWVDSGEKVPVGGNSNESSGGGIYLHCLKGNGFHVAFNSSRKEPYEFDDLKSFIKKLYSDGIIDSLNGLPASGSCTVKMASGGERTEAVIGISSLGSASGAPMCFLYNKIDEANNIYTSFINFTEFTDIVTEY